MKFKTLLLAAALTSSFYSVTAFSAPFILQQGEQSIKLQKTPQKIAVYDLSILDTLNALQVPVQLVPESSFTGNLAHYQQDKFIKAGSLFAPDTEKLKAEKPDLILVGGRSANAIDKVKDIAPVLNLSANTDNYMADLKQRTNLLAQAFSKQDIAHHKLAEIEKLQATLKAKTQGKSALMLFAYGDNFMPHAENDRFGFVYDFAGFQSVLPLTEKSDAPRPEAGSPEALALQAKNLATLQAAVAAQPDYLIVLDRGAVNTQKYTVQDSLPKHEVLKTATALKNQKVIIVNADAWYLTGAGLDNTLFMLQELNNAIPN